METTRLSEKGQIVIPKRFRINHGWKPGLEFSIEELEDGIKIKPLKPLAETSIQDVLGCMHYRGPRKTLKDMDAAIAKGAKESL